LIYSLVTVEQLLKPAEIAARSCLNKRAVLRDIRDGKFGDYYCRAENSIAVPASGVNKWRSNFRVPAKPEREGRRWSWIGYAIAAGHWQSRRGSEILSLQ
jgi:hypothetical protein